ncbi:MAG: hypothetical protein GF308_20860 [Candidatus Heimdallarchaeota archaeon]|nr:hypothetical protein [Candidatus Heimdallarchaeota archaeon]
MMTLPRLVPLSLSSSNPGFVKKYNFEVKLAQKTGTNGPRDLYSAYMVDFFDKYALAFAKVLSNELLIGYDGSRFHQSLSKSVLESLRRVGVDILELDGPVTVPEFMFACYKTEHPGLFFGRSHSPVPYIGLKLVINAHNAVTLLEKSGAEISIPNKLQTKKIYGFLPRTLAPVIEQAFGPTNMIHPNKIGTYESLEAAVIREAFFQSLKRITPLNKIEGSFIIDCRHSMAGAVWDLINAETNAEIILHNNQLNPIAPDRDPREIWDELIEKYHKNTAAVFDHDGDADRTFLVKTPGIGKEKIVNNQEESFTTGLLAEARERKAEAYVLVQERISLIMLSALSNLTEKVYATAQGEPVFFLGVLELLTESPDLQQISGADYTNIFFNKVHHPICMKSPYQQALWLMYWFTKNEGLPNFPSVDLVQTKMPMTNLTYPQRLEKVLASTKEITNYLEKNYQVIYRSTLDGQNLLLKNAKGDQLITSIRPSGTGRYTKIFTEIGLGPTESKKRKMFAEELNKKIVKIIDNQ